MRTAREEFIQMMDSYLRWVSPSLIEKEVDFILRLHRREIEEEFKQKANNVQTKGLSRTGDISDSGRDKKGS